tara:strand:- start:15905 stop:16174 length:270 start_codon:yes stop_codon:yes gene_type:complete
MQIKNNASQKAYMIYSLMIKAGDILDIPSKDLEKYGIEAYKKICSSSKNDLELIIKDEDIAPKKEDKKASKKAFKVKDIDASVLDSFKD